MVTYSTLAELEDAHDREREAARMRLELADEYIGYYRSRVHQVQEAFYNLAAHHGVADDAGFQEQLRRVSGIAAENVAQAGRKVADLEEQYDTMLHEHHDERERFITDSPG